MIDRKEVELLIRANLKGGRDLDTISKSIEEIGKAIEDQSAAAKRGEKSFDGLKASAEALKGVLEELGARSRSVQQFETLTRQIKAQEGALEAATKKLQAFQTQLGSGDRTDKQQEKLQKLTASQVAAATRLADLQRSSELLGAALREAGVDVGNLAGEQQRLAEQQAKTQTSLQRVNREFEEYNTNIEKARAATAAKAKEDREAARNAELFAAAENRAAEAAKTRARELAELRERQAVRRSEAQTFGLTPAQRAEEEAQLRRAKELAALREDIEQRSAGAVRDAGLRKLGEDAESTARQFTTLARASTDLRPKVVSLRDAINEIVNPGARARDTLDGAEASIKKISDTIKASKGPVVEYAAQFKELTAAQKSLQGQATLIDDFKRQAQALRQAREQFSAARADVTQYAAAVRQGGDAAAQFTKPLAEAQVRLRAASTALRDQVAAAREARDALRQAGIDSRSLVAAEERLVTATKAATGALKDLGDAAEKNGHAVRGSANSFNLFNSDGRTTLSLAQRLRGEILALVAAYIGVQGAIDLARESLKAFVQQQALRSTLSFALGGDPGGVAREIAFVRAEADRLGISLEHAGKGYAKFAAAAIKSGAPVNETREIFTAFSEVARVINLTPEELNALFNAIGQSFSKGKIQAEELRQQIGERLPGAFAFAQEALKKQFPDLNKALEEGKVGAENMLLIARSVQRAAQGELPNAIKTLDAEQQRFNNSVLDFKNQIAKAGFADAYVALLKQLIEFFKSKEGEDFAKQLGQIATAFVNGISSLVTYRDELKVLALVFAGLLGAKVIATVGASITALAGAMTAARIAAVAFSPVLLTLSSAFTVLAAAVAVFFAGFALGDLLQKNFQAVRTFGVALVVGLAKLWSAIRFEALELWEFDLPSIIEKGLNLMINRATLGFRTLLMTIRNGLALVGQDDLVSQIDKALDKLTLKPNVAVSARVRQLRAEREADLRRIEEIGDSVFRSLGGIKELPEFKAKPDGSDSRFGRRVDAVVRPSLIVDDDKKAKRQIEQIEKELDALRARALKKQEETLASLLEAIDVETEELGKRIAKVGGEKGKEFAARFKQAVAALKTEVTQDFNDKILKDQQTLLAKVEQLEAATGRATKDSMDARVNAVREANEAILRDIERQRQRAAANGLDTTFADQARARVEATTAEREALEKLKFLKEQLVKQEEALNNVTKGREFAIKRVEEQVKAGELTRGQGDTRIREIIAETQPSIAKVVDEARRFVETNREAFDPAKVDEFLLKLDQVKNSAAAMNAEFDRTGKIIEQGISGTIDVAFKTLLDSLTAVVQKTGDLKDVFENTAKAVINSLLDIIKQVALLIIKEEILAAIQAARKATKIVDVVTTVAGVAHAGGRVGPSMPRHRTVPASWFANAPRYHDGGFPGLGPREHAVIAEEGEQILSREAVRQGAGASSGAPAAAPQALKIVLVDDLSRVAEAMTSNAGEQATMMTIKKNIATVRQLIK